jgi:hypothetical protein
MSAEEPDRLPVHATPGVEPGTEVVTDRVTVVAALPLKRRARERLAELLGARVVDIRDTVDRADVVLTPPGSPQLIGMLRRKYGDDARIVVVELDDLDFDIELPGPVKRILRGGADAYVLADDLEELARKITRAPQPSNAHAALDESASPEARALPASATVDEIIAAFLRESIEYSTRLHTTDE